MILIRYLHTLKHLKPFQIFGRFFFIFKKFFIKKEKKRNISIRSFKKKLFFHPKKKSYLGKNVFLFLNKKKEVIFYDDSSIEDEELLWKYHLHYFDYLNQRDTQFNAEMEFLVLSWIKKNDFKKKIAWDSYPTSLRVVNWIKWIINNQVNNEEINENLFQQGRYLLKRIEYYLTGNHLLANAKALIFLGCFFKSTYGEEFLKKGLNLLEKELNNQILDDGGHYEKSLMYQSIVIEDLLDIYSISMEFPNFFNQIFLKEKILQMSKFLVQLTHSNGEKSYFNDCSEYSSLSFEDLDFYSKSLGIKLHSSDNGVNFLPHSEFISCRNESSNLLINYGSIGPDNLMAHAHANSLSFEFSLDNQKIFVNSGVSSYQNLGQRNKERGTASHNTLEIDRRNSSDVWSSFRCGKRAKTKIICNLSNKSSLNFKALHDGYSSFLNKKIHIRNFKYDFNSLEIKDSVIGLFFEAISRIHLHPDVIYKEKKILLDSGKIISFKYENCELNVIDSEWSRGFGDIVKSKTLEFRLLSKNSNIKFTW